MNMKLFFSLACLAIHPVVNKNIPATALRKNICADVQYHKTSAITKKVYVYYIIPENKKEREDYKTAIKSNILHVQNWYEEQLGKTFVLAAPVVQVLRSEHDDSWYSNNPNNSQLFFQFWENVISDAASITPDAKPANDRINIFYVDAHSACKQCGGCGNPGNVVIAANDLRGMIGESWIPACPGENYSFKPCRFSGGLAHELGHAFGLPHPPGEESKGRVMGSGFYDYPNCILSSGEKEKLLISDWSKDFFTEGIATKSFDCGNLVNTDNHP